MKFLNHQSFEKEFHKFVTKHAHCNMNESQDILKDFQRLLASHFDIKKRVPISSTYLGLTPSTKDLEIYWYKLIIPKCNLRKTQFPKSYFYKRNNVISFLSLGTHLTNYDDRKLRDLAVSRLSEIIDLFDEENFE